ncbi:MAG: DUF6353 family protein [Oscillospiraceae bacterium]
MRINIRKAGPLIATGLACAGVIVTALLAVKKAPEVQKAVEDARLEQGGALKPLEVVKAAAPSAWPVCAVAAGTIACIVGIQAMNQKQQASLVAMYGVAAKSLKKYDSTGDFASKEIGRSIRQRAAWFLQSDSDSTQIIRFCAKRRFYDLHELVVRRENVRQNTGISA